MLLSVIKKIIPKPIFKLIQKPYHYIMSLLAVLWYRFPSKKMIVIGVTGTSGKTTAVEMISKVLEGAGYKVGYASTAKWKIGKKEVLNNKKMTMLGRFQTQALLREMVDAGCKYAIIETTSEGIEQFRAVGIHYDIAVITNLYPEHIEAHGSFEKYKKAKSKLFRKLVKSKHKIIKKKNNKKEEKIDKVTVVNFDDENCKSFIQFNVDENYLFSTKNKIDVTNSIELKADKIKISPKGTSFTVQGVMFDLNILGQHNVYNALIAICVGVSQGMNLPKIASSLKRISKIDGRLEFIKNKKGISIIVDYAFEPKALTALYETVKKFGIIKKGKKIIHVLGSAGGGRDKSRRPELGRIVARNADVVIVTNEDPYDEDPEKIINQVYKGVESVNRDIQSYKIFDRREAINKAVHLAEQGDLVLITGKGCEQAIAVKNEKLIPWDDRKVVAEELENLKMEKVFWVA